MATATALAAVMAMPGYALAGPQNGSVAQGSATITQSGATTTINQSTNRAVINWRGFSIGSSETVTFNQPGITSATLNRVTGNDQSVINGALNANGQVFIVNQNGVLFGKGAQVNVGGLTASTLNITDTNFMAGNYTFNGSSAASVVNQGKIKASDGGYVALLGKTVSNDGVIVASMGTVAMASGEKITLNFDGNSLVDVTIDKGTLDALVENKKAIKADGGRVILTAKAADDILSAQVNNSGVIQARTMADLMGGSGAKTKMAKKGSIKLLAQGGAVSVSGKLDASAPKQGDGGFIETSGDKVQIADGAVITTAAANGVGGTWLVDPTNFTIAAAGGDITGAELSSILNGSNNSNNGVVQFSSSQGKGGTEGNVNVNDAVAWSSNATLQLTAVNDINVNKAITANGGNAGLTLNAGNDININNAVTFNGASASLAMTYGGDYNILTPASYSGAVIGPDGTPVAQVDPHDPAHGGDGVYGSITFNNSANLKGLTINGQTYTLIHSMSQLDGLDNTNSVTLDGSYDSVSGNYAIARNLDADGTTYASALVYFFGPGSLTGLGHTIKNLTINGAYDYNGLIGQTSGAVVLRDLGLVDVRISGQVGYVGALVGGAAGYLGDSLSISNAYSTGSVTGGNTVGGLAGTANTITYAYSSANVSGSGSVGGLVGSIFGYTDINVVPFGSGLSVSSELTHAHATGAVTASAGTGGGLAGQAADTVLDLVYAAGAVTGGSTLGGLLGNFALNNSIFNPSLTNAFATGAVTGSGGLGGLIGNMGPGSYSNIHLVGKTISVDNVYASGDVEATGGGYNGGLIGSVLMGSWNIGTYPNAPSFSISNAVASGDVTVTGASQSYAGGLVGQIDGSRYSAASGYSDACCGNAGSITNSSASGSVDASGVDNFAHVGGLIGYAKQTAITSSSASGAVTGSVTFNQGSGGTVGGLVGYAWGTSIASSYSSSVVSGIPARLGGLVGSGGPVTISSDSYFNNENATNGYGDQTYQANYGATDNSTGLTSSQFRDVQYYVDGTIGQVVAARTAAAQTANAVSASLAIASSSPPSGRMSSAGTQAATVPSGVAVQSNLGAVENSIRADDERDRRRVAASTASRPAPVRRRPALGGSIRELEVRPAR